MLLGAAKSSRGQKKRGVTTLRLFRIATIPATIVTLLAVAQPVSANTVAANSGFYDHQIIEYQAWQRGKQARGLHRRDRLTVGADDVGRRCCPC